MEKIENQVEEVKNETEVSAAASEEVVNEVKEEVIPSMENFDKEIEHSLKKIHQGDIVKGTIISIGEKEVMVNIGYISDGIITHNETGLDSEAVLGDHFKVGDEINAEVVKKSDSEGNVVLSIKKANHIIAWDELETAFKEEAIIDVKVKDAVKGGVVCLIKGVRAFIPASLLSVKYVEDLKAYVGKELKVKVAEFERETRKVILSRKIVEKAELDQKKKEIFTTIQKNDRFNGTVTKLMKFGAFVDIGGVEGLIHLNDLSWKKVKHPSEVVKEGDIVNVYVLSVDANRERIGLGLKDVNDDPWTNIGKKYQIGKVYEGSVERILDFGMFVKLESGVEGLVHVSELSEERVENPADMFAIGDTVKVKVLNIKTNDRKISLSVKEAADSIESADVAAYTTGENATTSLKDVFGAVLKDLNND